MAVQLLDSAGTNKVGIDAGNALKITQRPPYVGSNGAYRVCGLSGLMTTIAAGTGSAGHVFAFRWSHASMLCVVTKLRAKWTTIAGFTAAQEVGLDCYVARSYTADHGGGTGLTLTGNSGKKRSTYGTMNVPSIRVASTTALTGSSFTLDPHPIAYGGFSELAAGAAVPKGFFTLDVIDETTAGHPFVLTQNEGLVIRNTILMGAGGTARLGVEIEWLEVDAY